MHSSIDHKDFYEPPGGILIWILIFLELITFGVALIVLIGYSREDPTAYHISRLKLNTTFGSINTVFLLTSGYFMAESLKQFKANHLPRATILLQLTLLGGLSFLLLKGFEYYEKIEHGLTLGHDTFFNFYWLLTGFHVIHVFVGLTILGSILWSLKRARTPLLLEDYEASAAFWHMCDLIWLLLFPTLYLVL